MGVRDADKAWEDHAADRDKVTAVLGGRDKALPYVRELPGFDDRKTAAYRNGAYFLPMTARSQEALGGLVFAKAPVRNLPVALDDVVADVTRTGQDVDRFAEQAFDAVLATFCVCVVADYPATPAGMTVREAEDKGIRPYLTLYDGNAILAARFTGEGPVRQLGHVRLLESVEEPDPDDAWAMVCVEQVRVLDFDEAGLYRQRLFREHKSDDKVEWVQHGETIEPVMGGQRMSVIPAFFTNPRDAEPKPGAPPLRDIADVNIAHLNNSAALEWALAWTANPTPIFKGLNLKEGETVRLGSAGGLILSENGDAKFMEFEASGLSELRAAIEGKRRDGALMGARMLLEEGKAALAAETVRIQRAGETSIVAGVANAVSECLTKALTFLCEWAGVDSNVAGDDGTTSPLSYWLNTDLNPAGLGAQELTALLGAWQGGAITLRDLFENLQRADIIDPSKSFADHEEELATEGPALGEMDEPPLDEPAEDMVPA